MQDRITQLELNLEEERQGGDQLMDRIDRGREQVPLCQQALIMGSALRCAQRVTDASLFPL